MKEDNVEDLVVARKCSAKISVNDRRQLSSESGGENRRFRPTSMRIKPEIKCETIKNISIVAAAGKCRVAQHNCGARNTPNYHLAIT